MWLFVLLIDNIIWHRYRQNEKSIFKETMREMSHLHSYLSYFFIIINQISCCHFHKQTKILFVFISQFTNFSNSLHNVILHIIIYNHRCCHNLSTSKKRNKFSEVAHFKLHIKLATKKWTCPFCKCLILFVLNFD